jgi:ribosome-binding factor A
MGKQDSSRRARHRTAGANDHGIRGQRLEELIREEINSVLDSEISDSRLQGARITRVELTRDGSRARLWFTLEHTSFGSELHAMQAAFERAAGFFRSRLCEGLPLKRIPELRFCHDPSAFGAFDAS